MVAVSLKKIFFKQKTAYEISACLVGSEMCIRDRNRMGRLFKIKIPLVLPSLMTSFAIGMIVSFALYVPVYFIGAGRVTTLTVEALNLALSGSKEDLGIATFFQILFPTLLLFTVAFINRKTVKWKI